MPTTIRQVRAAAVAVLGAAAVAGCGVGAGESASDTQLLVTQDFGRATLVQTDAPETSGSDTVMRLLQRNAKVETRFGGGFVQSIDGVEGGSRDGRLVDWFFYVNGRKADEGSAGIEVHDGDRIWWDLTAWEASNGTPAVVGQYPAPFTTGLDGKRLPVRVECIDLRGPECVAVRDALVEEGVAASRGGLQTSLAQETLRVLVGPYEAVRADRAVRTLEQGPRRSGVFARFAKDGSAVALLDSAGRTTRTLRAGAGIVAATQLEDAAPVWMITGTDEAGVRAAAEAFAQGSELAGRYAVAAQGGRTFALPDQPER